MKTPTLWFAALFGLAASASWAAPTVMTTNYTGHELASQAHVSLTQARATALKARPGLITDQELEKEAGGTGLRYSFDVTGAGHKYEVGVDARTGKVLENKIEGANPD